MKAPAGYVPLPGSVAQRAIEHMARCAHGTTFSILAIARALGIQQTAGLGSALKTAVKHGALLRSIEQGSNGRPVAAYWLPPQSEPRAAPGAAKPRLARRRVPNSIFDLAAMLDTQ